MELTKRQAAILYIAYSYGVGIALTSFMKLCYFFDLMAMANRNAKITDFEYIRYSYGPFDSKIYSDIENLIFQGSLRTKSYSVGQEENILYQFNDINEDSFNPSRYFSTEEIGEMNQVLEEFKGFGAKTLTAAAYKTAPMIALNATLGGSENLGKRLNLELVINQR